ncbi:metal ABC transporter permease [Fulvimarina sp. 2208YS6-2-32]|uniref:Metal ABC transporter permease n=2 Tax=Fulvimarina uroteuthidis TaxID=3098149 RepID=A0ABU5I286_9HYPH|nr:metal ABC transporter permease [Fulvimarina sp. 2208YS6-2-32]MDY8109346.1 metal ABC transporter permease [Fulvimarina sp. 2208YS6-2-32]
MLFENPLMPFAFPFMREAMLIAVLVAVPTALLSCFLVLKGWSLMGDAISHAVLPGIVLAYILAVPLAIGAFVAGMVCAGATGYLSENSRVKEDTVMGIVFSGMFGFGLVLYTKIESDVHLDHILFGDMLGILPADLWQAGVIAAGTTLIVAVKWRDLLLHTFDPLHARAIGLPVRLIHYGLLTVLSLTIVAALKATGIILTIALLIAPGAIAYLLVRRFSMMLLTAMAISVGCSLFGVYVSFFLDSAPAPTIVLSMTIVFIAAFVYRSVLPQSGRAARDMSDPLTVRDQG